MPVVAFGAVVWRIVPMVVSVLPGGLPVKHSGHAAAEPSGVGAGNRRRLAE
jgi:hypothetical protein